MNVTKLNTIENIKDLKEGTKHYLEGNTIYAKCYKVIDGDTIKVWFYIMQDYSITANIRLDGIDTPERKQLGYNEATNRTKELVENKIIKLDLGKFDAFGRIISKVYTLDDLCINDILLNEKLAVIFKK